MSESVLLSPVRKKGSGLKVPEQGSWLSDPNFLRTYSADIVLEGSFDDRSFVQSIPSVFARPLQFARALSDESHPAHRAVVGQWRGLLAVVALWKWLEVSIEPTEYRARERGTEALSPEALRKGDGPLRAILGGQMPTPVDDWDRWWMIRCDGTLLGATSPWTLVYTPAEQKCPAKIPWQRNGILVDPIEHYEQEREERPRELALLAVWVGRVRRRFEESGWAKEKPHLEAPLGAIALELRRWETALDRYRQEEIGTPDVAHGLAIVPQQPFRSVLVPLEVQQVETPSDLVLDNGGGSPVLVFARDGIRPEKRVYGAVSAGDVELAGLRESERLGGWRTRSGRSIPWPYVFADEVFFPPKLAKLEVSEKAITGGSSHYALPLTSRILTYFDLAALSQGRLRIEIEESEPKVVVALHLPLRGGGQLTVKRSYDRATELIEVGDLTPALYLWPDFADPRWRHNFALASAPETGEMTISPLTFQGERLAPASTDGSEKTFRLWNHTEPLAGFVLLAEQGHQGAQEAGLILRRAPAVGLQRRAVPDWRVAVDFGTSSTNVLVQEGSASPRPLAFQNRTLVLARGGEQFENELSRRFYSTQEVLPPFPTVLMRDEASLLAGQTSLAATNEILVPRFAVSYLDFLFRGQVERVVKDLKWSNRGGTAADVPIREYLTGVARAVCCEAFAAGCRNMTFGWSYPLALPVRTREAMSSFWQSGISSFSVPGELVVQAEEGVSESEAFCRFLAAVPLASLPLLANSLSVAVDIGGGSTDIAFWSEARLLDQVSLKLAGNDILVPLARLPGFWTGLAEACDPGRIKHEGEEEKLQHEAGVVLNALLTQARDHRGQVFAGDPREHPVPAALASRLREAESPWSNARSLIHLFAQGLAFYVGLHARKFLPNLPVQQVNLRFGGRGAALFPWLARNAQLRLVLEAAFREGVCLDQDENKTCKFAVAAPGLDYDPMSPLKGEVVRGLLLRSLAGEAPRRPETTLLGEVGWDLDDDTPLAWDAEVGPAEIRRLRPPINHASSFATHFLQRVVPKQAVDLGLDLEGLRAVELSSAAIQNYLRAGVVQGTEVLQPVFAVELKVMLEDYIQKALAAR